MKSNISTLFPSVYNGVLETDTLANVLDNQFDNWFIEMDDALKNQFILTANEQGIKSFEALYKIKADPLTETLEVRRRRVLNRKQMQPPFTLNFLRERLDEMFGKGQYEIKIDTINYTLQIITPPENLKWHKESSEFIGFIKPANMMLYVGSVHQAQNTVGAFSLIYCNSCPHSRLRAAKKADINATAFVIKSHSIATKTKIGGVQNYG